MLEILRIFITTSKVKNIYIKFLQFLMHANELGIYEPGNTDYWSVAGYHAVVIKGWGRGADANGDIQNYWIVANSWSNVRKCFYLVGCRNMFLHICICYV